MIIKRSFFIMLVVLGVSIHSAAISAHVSVTGSYITLDGAVWTPKYLAGVSDYQAVANQGFNLVCPKNFDDTAQTTISAVDLQAIQTANVGFVFPVMKSILLNESHGIMRIWDDSDLTWIKPIIEKYKNEPLFRFYWVDDPISAGRAWTNGNTAIIYDRLVKLKAWIRRIDGNHPLFVNFSSELVFGSSGRSAIEWANNTADLACLSFYPIKADDLNGSTGLGHFKRLHYLTNALKGYTGYRKSFVAPVQSWADLRTNFVLPSEVRASAISAMLNGADGYYMFSASQSGLNAYNLAADFPAVWAELKTINDVNAIVGPSIARATGYRLEAKRDIFNMGSDNVSATLYTAEDSRLFLVVLNLNQIHGSNNVLFKCAEWSGLADGTRKAKSLFGGTDLILASGSFMRNFAPLDGDIYEIVVN